MAKILFKSFKTLDNTFLTLKTLSLIIGDDF